ncbi:hypothetical protein AAG570_000204 [Ranatra chinensis]|uniref:Mitochondrial import receptor subunit TOM22 homolog n=1 Tax=Ranatra chinensis TaxID=642074 RepID=A0ABD0Z917_9HEMI
MASGEESDSGMGSMPDSSKDCTPEKPKHIARCIEDDIEDETLSERLWGLTEMFPEKMRTATYSLYCGTKSGLKNMYNISRTGMWIFFSSSAILFAPVLFEVERAQFEEAQRSQQKQVSIVLLVQYTFAHIKNFLLIKSSRIIIFKREQKKLCFKHNSCSEISPMVMGRVILIIIYKATNSYQD